MQALTLIVSAVSSLPHVESVRLPCLWPSSGARITWDLVPPIRAETRYSALSEVKQVLDAVAVAEKEANEPVDHLLLSDMLIV